MYSHIYKQTLIFSQAKSNRKKITNALFLDVHSGSFTGETLYMNQEYISPNLARAAEHRRKGGVYANRVNQKEQRKARQDTLVMEKDAVDDVFR